MDMREMQVISTRTHGILDYLTVGFALAFPRILGCDKRFTNAVTLLALGKLAYSMMTRHELGLIKLIPMKAHLAMDAVGGTTMCALPAITDEENRAAVTCAAGLGLMDIAAAALTERESPYDRAAERERAPFRRMRGRGRTRAVAAATT